MPEDPIELTLRQREAQVRVKLHAHAVHPGQHDALVAYTNEGEEPSPFLRAVLENDLLSATLLSDDSNTIDIRAFVRLMIDELDTLSWGSREHVNGWVSSAGERGKLERAAAEPERS